jgi:AraC-like DNA-binding protein
VAPIDVGIVDLDGATLDRAAFAVLPRGTRAIAIAKSPVARVLVLAPSAALLARTVAIYGGEIDARRLASYLATHAVYPRTNWMNEILHRYLFERAVCKKTNNDATRFLESEIVKEVYFLAHARATTQDRASVVATEGDLVKRARRHVEEHLFEPDVVAGLARACGASESTLLRSFKRELGQGPLAYVRARRLDESMLLLRSKKHSVGEVAVLVGYDNLSAFSTAFRARFGMRPSEVRMG